MASAVLHLFLIITSVTSCKILVAAGVNEHQPINSVNMVQSGSFSENMLGNGQDSAHLVSCLGVKGEQFNVTWTPAVLKTDETVYVYVDVITTQKFTTGKVCTSVWLDNIPDPIYEECRVQYCDQFIPAVLPYLPQLKCPIPQGFHIKQVFPFKIVPTIPLPAGNYKAKLEVWNEDSVHTLCFTGNIVIEDE